MDTFPLAEHRPMILRPWFWWSEDARPASRRSIWIGFGAVHAWLALVGVVLMPQRAFRDLVLCRSWVALGLHGGLWPVFSGPSVYPVGALVPMILPAALTTTSTTLCALGWCAMVTALDAVAVHAHIRRGGARGARCWRLYEVNRAGGAAGR